MNYGVNSRGKLRYAFWRHRDGSRLTAEGYRRTGGVLGALGTRAEELYQKQPASGQEAIRQVFLRLVGPSATVEENREAFMTMIRDLRKSDGS